MPAPYYYHGLIVQPDCHLCPLRGDRMVLPDGIYPAKLCIVGEGPGTSEVREGRGFVGATGKAQWVMCANGGDPSGFTREQVWTSNCALCQPRKVLLASGATLGLDLVKKLSAKACRRRLIGELLSVTQGNPEAVVVAVGRLAFETLTGNRGKINDYRGSVNPVDLQKLWEEVNT